MYLFTRYYKIIKLQNYKILLLCGVRMFLPHITKQDKKKLIILLRDVYLFTRYYEITRYHCFVIYASFYKILQDYKSPNHKILLLYNVRIFVPDIIKQQDYKTTRYYCFVISDSFLAETSVSSPQILFIFIILKNIF